MMERIIPTSMTGTINATYEAGLTSIVNYITNTKGVYAIVDPHNFGRYYGNIITDDTGFEAFWKTLATVFAGNSKVIFDCNNEPHDMGAISVVTNMMQACINGVRAAGATSQYIFVEGTSYSGAWTWVSAGNGALSALTDPQNKIVYEMHQYLDSDGSGTSATCVSSTIGSSRLAAATAWLKQEGKMGIIGEFAGGANSVCESAVTDMLTYMGENTDVWLGGIWWGGGPWWGSYIFSMEPPSGIGYEDVLPLMLPLI
jgi:endoglucanase